MNHTDLELVTPKHKYERRAVRGMYVRAVQKFLDSEEHDLEVKPRKSVENTYNGLRDAVIKMGLKGTVYVGKNYGEVHLIRLE